MVSLLSMTSPNCAQFVLTMQNFKKVKHMWTSIIIQHALLFDYLPNNTGITKPWLKPSSHAVIAVSLRLLVTYSVLLLSSTFLSAFIFIHLKPSFSFLPSTNLAYLTTYINALNIGLLNGFGKFSMVFTCNNKLMAYNNSSLCSLTHLPVVSLWYPLADQEILSPYSCSLYASR